MPLQVAEAIEQVYPQQTVISSVQAESDRFGGDPSQMPTIGQAIINRETDISGLIQPESGDEDNGIGVSDNSHTRARHFGDH